MPGDDTLAGRLPIVDLSDDAERIARSIDAACRDVGFFYVVNHGVPVELGERLEQAARDFFAFDEAEKAEIEMARSGLAWRGWFPAGGELTSGVPDRKEGIYFGEELADDDPRVAAGTPLHGANLFPRRPAELAPAVLDWLDAMTGLGHRLVAGVALALGLDEQWFHRRLTADPLVLFRIFRYPATIARVDTGDWGVAEHTDYGLLTILRQDATSGLEVRTRDGWTGAPPIEGSFVVNIGDMLDRMTGGRYRSTPHRVRPSAEVDRLSFPFFFDPSWDAEVAPLPLGDDDRPADDAATRWDRASVHDHLRGTYGDYLWSKVSKVFPDLT